MKISTTEVNKARIYKFTHKDRRVTYGLLHWPWYIVWHCAAYRSWYFAVSFGICLTGSSCLNWEQQWGKKEVRTHFLQCFAVEGKSWLHRVSTGVETQKHCFSHAIMRSTKKWETHGSAREILSDFIYYKSARHCLLRTVGIFSAVRSETWRRRVLHYAKIVVIGHQGKLILFS